MNPDNDNKKISVTKEEQERLEQEFLKLNEKMNQKLGTTSVIDEVDSKPAITPVAQNIKKNIETSFKETDNIVKENVAVENIENEDILNNFSQTATLLKIDPETQKIAKEKLEKDKLNEKKKITKSGNNETLSAIVGFLVVVGIIVGVTYFFMNPKKEISTDLKALNINGKNINLIEGQTNYSITFPVYMQNLNVNAQAEDSNAVVTVSGNNNLEIDNNIIINVKNGNESSKYSIKVIFENYDDLSNQNNDDFIKNEWIGKYTSIYGDDQLTIDFDDDSLIITVYNSTEKSTQVVSTYDYTIDDVMLELDSTIIDESIYVRIIKNKTDIDVMINSSDSTSIFNNIYGKYKKQNNQ